MGGLQAYSCEESKGVITVQLRHYRYTACGGAPVIILIEAALGQVMLTVSSKLSSLYP